MFQYCLSAAIKDSVTAIAFPCVGAGGLEYDQMTVFSCLQDAIKTLSVTTTSSLKVFYLRKEWNNNILFPLISLSKRLALISDMYKFNLHEVKINHTLI